MARGRKFFLGCLGILLILAAVLTIAIYMQRAAESRAYAQRVEEFKAKGYPLTIEELEASYEAIPANENAALLYEAAFASLAQGDLSLGSLPEDPAEPLAEDVRAGVAEALAQNAEGFNLLHQAAALNRARYSFGLFGNPSNSSPFSMARVSAGLLQWEAALQAEENNTAGALESVRVSLRLSDSLADGFSPDAHMSRIAGYGSALRALERVFHKSAPDDAQLRSLAEALARSEGLTEGAAPRVLVGELLQASSNASAATLPTSLRKRMVNDLIGMALAVDAPTHERLERLKEATPPFRTGLITAHLAAVTAPAITRIVESDLECLAELRAARTAVAIERYRLANGALPETLDALVPQYLDAVPRDPFNNQPLRYNRLDGGYVVYSVGIDLADNAGTERTRKGVPSDNGFTVKK